MELAQRASAEIVDFAAYRAQRLQRSLWDAPAQEDGSPAIKVASPPPPSIALSERQLAHRKRMLAFLLTPR